MFNEILEKLEKLNSKLTQGYASHHKAGLIMSMRAVFILATGTPVQDGYLMEAMLKVPLLKWIFMAV